MRLELPARRLLGTGDTGYERSPDGAGWIVSPGGGSTGTELAGGAGRTVILGKVPVVGGAVVVEGARGLNEMSGGGAVGKRADGLGLELLGNG